MITGLPYTLTVDGVERAINCDFRDVIEILACYNDPELSDQERGYICLHNLYVDDFTTFGDIEEAQKQAVWFLDGGKEYKEAEDNPRLLDWEQDYNLIISAVNKVVGDEVRDLEFAHWWTFLGFFTERGECRYNLVVEIRDKLARGKKLEKHERQYLRDNRDEIVLKTRLSEEEQAIEDELFGGGDFGA